MHLRVSSHLCARCGDQRLRKNGHATNVAQRAKCLNCLRTFVLERVRKRYEQAFKDQLLDAHQNRTTIRETRRIFGVGYQTIMHQRKQKRGACLSAHTCYLPVNGYIPM